MPPAVYNSFSRSLETVTEIRFGFGASAYESRPVWLLLVRAPDGVAGIGTREYFASYYAFVDVISRDSISLRNSPEHICTACHGWGSDTCVTLFLLYMYNIFRLINGRFVFLVFLYFFTDGESAFVGTVNQYRIGDQHRKPIMARSRFYDTSIHHMANIYSRLFRYTNCVRGSPATLNVICFLLTLTVDCSLHNSF